VDPDDPPTRVARLRASRPVGDLAAAVAIAAAARLLLAPPVWRRLEPRLAAPTRTALGALLRRNAPSPVWRSFSDEQRAYVQEVAELGPDLAGIGCPVVILVGETDHVVAPTAGARLAVAIPGATLTSVPGTGHLLPHDAPRAVSDAVDDVAGRVSAP
jgi:pimeloyl-ACP methyl ester carboxylesterase